MATKRITETVSLGNLHSPVQVDMDAEIEPLWIYRSTPGRRRVSMLDDVRARAGANRP